jgi:phospholipase C
MGKIKLIVLTGIILITAFGCAAPTPVPTLTPTITETIVPSETPAPTHTITPTLTPTLTPTVTPTEVRQVPNFSHIAIIVLENREFDSVVGNSGMPNFNGWAKQYTLLTQYYAIRHPSLPNYIAMIGGDTFGITSDCVTCYINATSLPDLIEASGRTWKAYMESMPEPCHLTDTLLYYPKHNPFIYFDPIRTNTERCQSHVVPLTDLESDLSNGTLPNFIFISPNICNDAHDCSEETADNWLGKYVDWLLGNPEMAKDGLIVITWDEGQGDHTCCDLTTGGGRVATILISSLVKTGFEDATPYTHYSLLKTISNAWDLEYLVHAADASNVLIEAPWKFGL